MDPQVGIGAIIRTLQEPMAVPRRLSGGLYGHTVHLPAEASMTPSLRQNYRPSRYRPPIWLRRLWAWL